MSETEINIDSGKLVTSHTKWHKAEQDAASLAGTQRQQIGEMGEKMGIEPKALSQFRAGLKIKNEGKRQDWLRSMEALLPIARNQIMGNQGDMFDGGEAADPEIDKLNQAFDGQANTVAPFVPEAAE